MRYFFIQNEVIIGSRKQFLYRIDKNSAQTIAIESKETHSDLYRPLHMRLNRENTLIENNLQPCAGMYPADIQKKFVNAFEPYREYINQIQAALFLKNIKLFVTLLLALIIIISTFSFLICSSVPNVVVFVIAIPIVELFYCFDFHLFLEKMFIKIEEGEKDASDRVRTLEEVVAIFWKPILTLWRVGFFIYRTFVCPNPVDTIALILLSILVGFLNRYLHFLTLFTVFLVLTFFAPAILTKTPLGGILKNLTVHKKEKPE